MPTRIKLAVSSSRERQSPDWRLLRPANREIGVPGCTNLLLHFLPCHLKSWDNIFLAMQAGRKESRARFALEMVCGSKLARVMAR